MKKLSKKLDFWGVLWYNRVKEVKKVQELKKATAVLEIRVLDSGEIKIYHRFYDKAGTATLADKTKDYTEKVQLLKDYLNK